MNEDGQSQSQQLSAQAPTGDEPSGAPKKRRHLALTIYLVIMLLANAGTVLTYTLGGDAVKLQYPNMQDWMLWALTAAGTFNLACVFALFKFKKWGFWGFCAMSVLALIINSQLGLSIVAVLSGLIGIPVLYGFLHIGKEKKAWPQLD